MIPLTKKEEKNYNNQKVCYYVKKNLIKVIKNIIKRPLPLYW